MFCMFGGKDYIYGYFSQNKSKFSSAQFIKMCSVKKAQHFIGVLGLICQLIKMIIIIRQSLRLLFC